MFAAIVGKELVHFVFSIWCIIDTHQSLSAVSSRQEFNYTQLLTQIRSASICQLFNRRQRRQRKNLTLKSLKEKLAEFSDKSQLEWPRGEEIFFIQIQERSNAIFCSSTKI